MAAAATAGLRVDDATVLHASNRIAVRLLPADVVARVAHDRQAAHAGFEVEVAERLTVAGCPVGTLDPRVAPRVHLQDGFAVTLWTHYGTRSSEIAPPAYASALVRLHAGLRQVEMAVPHFTSRVAEARSLLDDRPRTPDLGDADRRFLDGALDGLTAAITRRGADEQQLHGEPHPGNLLNTRVGPRFIDLETAVRGPVEYDIAHAPDGTGAHYPEVDEALLTDCRNLMLAMFTTWRWDRDDELPDGRARASEWIGQLRTALDRRTRGRH